MGKKYSMIFVFLMVTFLFSGCAKDSGSFGELLPNTLEMSNNLRGDVDGLLAYADVGEVVVPFTYVGKNVGIISQEESFLIRYVEKKCSAKTVSNLVNADSGLEVEFNYGEKGVIVFSCDELILGETLVGFVSIPTINPKTRLNTSSKGTIRVSIE